jgi:hypothetical protein
MFGFVSFSFLGHFVFNGTFDLIKNGKHVRDLNQYGIDALTKTSAFGTTPWLRLVVLVSPVLGNDAFYTMALNTARTRYKNGIGTQDCFHYLVSSISVF